MENNSLSFNLQGIKSCQENRYPCLFIDKITEAIPGKSAKGYKNFTYNEWFFPAHFEDEPNVPGFIQIECLVQVFIMTFLCIPEYRGKKTNFVSINNVKFRYKIEPGDKLDIETSLDYFKRGIAKGRAESFVNGNPACCADFVVTLPDILDKYKPKGISINSN